MPSNARSDARAHPIDGRWGVSDCKRLLTIASSGVFCISDVQPAHPQERSSERPEQSARIRDFAAQDDACQGRADKAGSH
jgi:hypothetical protein